MKYRRLSPEELEPLKEDFIQFLSANTITGDDWAKTKANKPEEAQKIIGLFSDIVWEKSLEKIESLEHRDDRYLKVFLFEEKKISMVGFSVQAEGAPSLFEEKTFSDLASGALKFSELEADFFTSTKNYTKERSYEMFEMMEAGCTPCEKSYFYGIKSLMK
ncbi:MAG: DUF6495 family protein [Flavobacteriales bacterium]|nr:DUF6495 family protein [Flavobacteriales bacterium]